MKLRLWLIFILVAASITLLALLYIRFFYADSLPPITSRFNEVSFAPYNVHHPSGSTPTSMTDTGAEIITVGTDPVKIPGRTYPITDGKMYRIVPVREYSCEDYYEFSTRYVESFEVKINGKWKEVYRTEDEGDGHCRQSFEIGDDVSFSPLKDYVRFSLIGWEWNGPVLIDTLLINTHTGYDILKDGMYPSAIIWSKDGRSYAFISHIKPVDGWGKDGVWTSGYHQPEKSSLIFDGPSKMGISENDSFTFSWKYMIDDLKFVNNDTIAFAIYNVDESNNSNRLGEVARYRYDLKAGKLTKVSGE